MRTFAQANTASTHIWGQLVKVQGAIVRQLTTIHNLSETLRLVKMTH